MIKQKKLPKVATSKEYTQNYINAWAEDLEIPDIFLYFPNLEELLQEKQVLDIGCADGFFVDMLSSRGIDSQGIDLFQKAEKPNLVQGDFMTYQFDRQYDVIFGHNIFEKDAIYSPRGMPFSQEETSFKNENCQKNPPEKMLRRLNELLNKDGFCIFSICTSPLIFSRDMARAKGFRLKRYVRSINTNRYPVNKKYSAVLRPETKYVLSREK